MDGILAINKPTGITSYDVIRKVKKLLPRGTKIGHAGTLDPFAEGVLLLLLGKATKRFDEIRGWKKTYRAVAVLGAKSDTLDREGIISKQDTKVPIFTRQRSELQKVADKWVGEREQTVPAYAAAKYKGRKLYEYAREGVVVPEKTKKVMIYSIEIVDARYYDNSNHRSEVEMRVECGSGTYIRQLSYDIMKELGVESYLEKLVREQVGKFTLRDCIQLEQVVSLDMVEQLLQHAPGE